MPMYEFKCPQCGNTLTKLCKMGETGQELRCPHCGNTGLNRLISSFASPGVSGASGGGGCPSSCGGNCSSCH